jgi:hypothetical protein
MRFSTCLHLLLLVCAMALAPQLAALAHHSEEHDWLLSWIPTSCCVTSDCCYRIEAGEIEPQPEDRWKIRATGQVLKRTDWSPDGRTYRCACVLQEGKYVQDRSAHTYCIFPAMQSVAR